MLMYIIIKTNHRNIAPVPAKNADILVVSLIG